MCLGRWKLTSQSAKFCESIWVKLNFHRKAKGEGGRWLDLVGNHLHIWFFGGTSVYNRPYALVRRNPFSDIGQKNPSVYISIRTFLKGFSILCDEKNRVRFNHYKSIGSVVFWIQRDDVPLVIYGRAHFAKMARHPKRTNFSKERVNERLIWREKR